MKEMCKGIVKDVNKRVSNKGKEGKEVIKEVVKEMKEEEKMKYMLYMLYNKVYGDDKVYGVGVLERECVGVVGGGREVMEVEVKNRKKGNKSKRIPMPYTGLLKEECCESIRENYGLYTQCENVKEESSSSSKKYCKECEKEKAYEKYGNIERRMSMEKGKYVDMRGKKETNYKKVLEKLGISKEEALEEGKKKGIELEEYYVEVEVKRGRPKKEKEVVEKVEEKVVEKEVVEKVEKVVEKEVVEVKRKKGRPRKAEKVLESSNEEEEDMFKEIVKKMEKMEVVEEKVEVEVVEEEEEEVFEDIVKKLKYEGKEYLKSKLTNIVYNMEEEIVGRWDEKERRIIFAKSESEEEENESEEEEEEEYV